MKRLFVSLATVLALAAPAAAQYRGFNRFGGYGGFSRFGYNRAYRFVAPFVQASPVCGVPVAAALAVAPAYAAATQPCDMGQLNALPNYSMAQGIPYGVGTPYADFGAFLQTFPVSYHVVVRRYFRTAFIHGIGFRDFARRAVVVRGGRFGFRDFSVRRGRVVARGRRTLVVRPKAKARGAKRGAGRRGVKRSGRRGGRRK